MQVNAQNKLAEMQIPEKISMRTWLSLAILLLFFILSAVDRMIIGLMVDMIKADLDVTDFQIGLLQGLAFALFYALASIPMAWIADKTSRHWVIFAGVTIWSIFTALCGLATSYWQLFLARVGVGAGEATLSPSAYALVSDLFPPRRIALAVGILAGGLALGGGLAVGIGGAAVQLASEIGPVAGLRPWQMTFILVGLPGVLLAPLVFLVPRPKVKILSAPEIRALPGLAPWLRHNWLYLTGLFLGMAFHAVLAYAMMTWAPAYFSRHFGLEPIVIGSTLGLVISMGGLIGFIGGGWFTDWLYAAGIRNAHLGYCAINCVLVSVLGVAAFAFAPTVWVSLTLLFFIFALQCMTGPAVASLQMTTPNHFRARTIALMTVTYTLIGMIIGPSGTPFFADFLFSGPDDIGLGLAVLFAVFGPLGALSFFVAMAPALRAAAERKAAAEKETGDALV